jgi:hypothetical protein
MTLAIPAQRLVDQLTQRYCRLQPPGQTAIECASDVLDVVRRTWDASRTRWLLGPAVGRFPELTPLARRINWRGALSLGERRFVLSIDGSRDLESLLQDSHLDPLHAAQLVCALALLGALVFEEAIELEEIEVIDDRPSHVSILPPPPENIVLDDPFPRGDSRRDGAGLRRLACNQ